MNIERRSGMVLAICLRALPVNLEQHVTPAAKEIFDLRARRAIEIAKHLRVLQKPAAVDHVLKLGCIDEEIVTPLLFARPHLSGRV